MITQKQQWVTKGLSIIIGAIGLYIIFTVWHHMFTSVGFKSSFDFVFLFVFPIPATGVAVYFLYTAWILWRELTPRTICKLSAVLSILFAMAILSMADLIYTAVNSLDFWSMINVPIMMILAGLFYLAVKNSLFKWFSLTQVFDCKAHNRATKFYFLILALFVWTALSHTADLLPRDTQYTHIAENRWLEGLIMLGSIFVAILLYRKGVKHFLIEKEPAREPLSVS